MLEFLNPPVLSQFCSFLSSLIVSYVTRYCKPDTVVTDKIIIVTVLIISDLR